MFNFITSKMKKILNKMKNLYKNILGNLKGHFLKKKFLQFLITGHISKAVEININILCDHKYRNYQNFSSSLPKMV